MDRCAQYFSCRDRQPNYEKRHQRCFHLLKIIAKIHSTFFLLNLFGEDAVCFELPEKFGFMLYGRLDDLINFVAILFVYMHHGESKEVLITSAPLLKEGSLSAQQNHDFIRKLLSLYKKHLLMFCFRWKTTVQSISFSPLFAMFFLQVATATSSTSR